MKKSVTVIILTAIVFLSSVFLGFATVYRIDVVWLDPATISEASTKEVEELHARLLNAYDKKSYFFVDEKPAKQILADFPYFRLSGFEKTSPNRIVVKIEEDEEVYAVPVVGVENSYYILGEEGTVLGIREVYTNRLDGEDNVLIKGLEVNGEKGKLLFGDEICSPLFTFCKAVSQELAGIRKNVVEIEVLKLTETIVKITMREGVKIYIGNISSMTEEKAEKVMQLYLGLSDEERLAGRIAISDSSGRLIANYAQKDEFDL